MIKITNDLPNRTIKEKGDIFVYDTELTAVGSWIKSFCKSKNYNVL